MNQSSATMAPDSAFSNFVVASTVCATSLFSLGISGSFVFSLSTIYIIAISLLAFAATGRISIDRNIYAAGFYLLTLSVATLIALDRGADLFSFLRGGVWFLIFLLLYDSFCRCDYGRVLRPVLWFSVILAAIHLIQIAQGYFGMSPLRIVPDAWHFSGEVRWAEDWASPRPAVIFTEVSWYAYYQIIVVSLALIWAPVELTTLRKLQLGLIFVSLLWSGSLTGIVLLIAVLGLWLIRRGRIGTSQLLTLALIAIMLTIFVLVSPIGQQTLGRLLLEQGSGSFNLRIIYPWIRAFDVLGQWPLAGVGIGNEGRAGAGTVPVLVPQINNLFAYFLATTGLLGTGGLLGFLVVIGRRFPLELMYFLLLGFVSAYGLGENFWVPALVWAGTVTKRTRIAHSQRLRANGPEFSIRDPAPGR